MKGDFTRNTFDSAKHYQQVLMQQGRAQLDADWNEQAATTVRRDETTSADIVGDHGGPADHAAFGIAVTKADWDAALAHDETLSRFTAEIRPKLPDAAVAGNPVDFLLTPGRYYVDGIQCELEAPVFYTTQPDRPTVPPIPAEALGPAAEHNPVQFVCLDVFRRHLTAVEAPGIREVALGGPDTATRVKTVWQVRTMPVEQSEHATPTEAALSALATLRQPREALLTADTTTDPEHDVCSVPATAGYTGLENQLYRVEVHARIHSDAGERLVIKWSRNNAGLVATVRKPDSTAPADETPPRRVYVSSLGPDQVSGFRAGARVELFDDRHELELSQEADRILGLATIQEVDRDERALILEAPPVSSAGGNWFNVLDFDHGPRARQWDGLVEVSTRGTWFLLECGLQVRFDSTLDRYQPGDYWLIPARTATADSLSGEIEWPRYDADHPTTPNARRPMPALEPTHHFAPLALLRWDERLVVEDLRNLFPALTAPRLFYVSGDGQEVMPPPGQLLAWLPHALQVHVGPGRCLGNQCARVRFSLVEENVAGSLSLASGSTIAARTLDVPITPDWDGVAQCFWALDASQWNDPRRWIQRVEARLLDPHGNPLAPPVRFAARLSVANQVAYLHGGWRGPVRIAFFRLTEGARRTKPFNQHTCPQIDFQPSAGLERESDAQLQGPFIIRWTGTLRPQYSEEYVFCARTNGGVSVKLNGKVILTNVEEGARAPEGERVLSDERLTPDRQPHESIAPDRVRDSELEAPGSDREVPAIRRARDCASAPLQLLANELYELTMEYSASGPDAFAQLCWRSPSTPQAIIPPDGITVHEALDVLYGNYSLSYLGGDGQLVTPYGDRPWMTPQSLRVRVANGRRPAAGATVRFAIAGDPGGTLESVGSSDAGASPRAILDVTSDLDGLAECRWILAHDPHRTVQEVTAALLGTDGSPLAPPLRFSARFSPGWLEPVAGDGQSGRPGTALSEPILIRVNSVSGPVAGAKVNVSVPPDLDCVGQDLDHLTAAEIEIESDDDGLVRVYWKLGTSADPTQRELTARLRSPASGSSLRFMAWVREGWCWKVGVGGDFTTLQQAFAALADQPSDLCLSLLPGDHACDSLAVTPYGAGAPRLVAVREPKIAHLRIAGSGQGTRLAVKGSLAIQGFDSLLLRDLALTDASEKPGAAPSLHVGGCRDVTIDNCCIAGGGGALDTPLVVVEGADRFVLLHSTLEVFTGHSLSPLKELFDAAAKASGTPLAAAPASSARRRLSRDLYENVVALEPEKREALRSALTRELERSGERLQPDERMAVAAAADALGVSDRERERLRESLDHLEVVAKELRAGTALLIRPWTVKGAADDSCVIIEGCTIDGEIGLPMVLPKLSQGPFTPAENDEPFLLIYQAVQSLKRGSFLGEFHLRGNRLGRLRMWNLAPADASDASALAPRQCVLDGNTVSAVGNQLVGRHVGLATNHFIVNQVDETIVAGWSIANRASFVGNHGDAPSTSWVGWRDWSPPRISATLKVGELDLSEAAAAFLHHLGLGENHAANVAFRIQHQTPAAR